MVGRGSKCLDLAVLTCCENGTGLRISATCFDRDKGGVLVVL